MGIRLPKSCYIFIFWPLYPVCGCTVHFGRDFFGAVLCCYNDLFTMLLLLCSVVVVLCCYYVVVL